jgi:hypothetical protein
VRLLKLPKVWQDRVAAGELPESFARLLVPMVTLQPVLDGLDQLFRGKRVKGTWHNKEAFESRTALEEAIDDMLETVCRLPKNARWVAHKHQVPKIDLANEQVRKELGIVEVELPSGTKGKTEVVPVATNAKAFDAVIKQLDARAEKRSAEKGGRDDRPAKRELTAAEQKERAKQQGEQLRGRVAAWRHKLLRRACIQAIEAGLDTGLRVVLAHACSGRNYKGLSFADALEEVRKIKPRRPTIRPSTGRSSPPSKRPTRAKR